MTRHRSRPDVACTYVANHVGTCLGAVMLCLMFTGCSTGSGNAAPAAAAQAESPKGDVNKPPNYRQVVIAAQSHDNRPLPKLSAQDLRLYQDKQLQIAFFKPQPAAVGIIVDTSGSMDPKLPLCRSALESFIGDLSPSDDLFAFSDRPFLLAKWTTDHATVIERLAILHAYGRTALYDSVTDMLKASSHSHIKRRAILLITDGIDSASSGTLQQTEDMARKMNIPIYSIGIGNPNPHSSSSWFTGMAGSTEALDTKALTALASASGGETFVVTLDNKGAALKRTAAAIAGKIGSEYVVGFVGDGSTNQLRIEPVNHKEIVFKVESGQS
jgi:VWFA-related protein